MAIGDPGRAPLGTARDLLGIPLDATTEEQQAAYWKLRAHVAARAASSSERAFVGRREAELEALDSLARQLGCAVPATATAHGPPAEPAPSAAPAVRGPAWLWAWASAMTVATLALATALLLRGPSLAPVEPAAAPPSPGSVAARATPAGSVLEVLSATDEHIVVRGAADGTPYQVAPGGYVLRVSRADCPDDWVQPVTLDSDQSREYAPRICEGEAQLVVRSNVSGDRVQIDGIDVGSTGKQVHQIEVGEHEVRVQKEGYEPWVGQIRVGPDEELTLRAEMSPVGGAAVAAAAAPETARAPDAPESPDAEADGDAAQAQAPQGEQDSRAGRSGGEASEFDHGVDADVIRVQRGGSKAWHDRTVQRLLQRYDDDASGALDTLSEVEAIPCEEWRAIEESYRSGGLAVPMTRLYGFDGSAAPRNTLGIEPSIRSYAYDQMKACGLP